MITSAIRRRLLTYSLLSLACGPLYSMPPASAATTAFHGTTVTQAIRQTPRLRRALAAGMMSLMYVSDYAGDVLAYDATYSGGPPRTITTPVETITGLRGPTGLAVDPAGNLYVVESAANDVKVFAPGSVTPFKTLSGGTGASAQYVALDGNGTVYVSNAKVIWVYRNGATRPSTVFSDPSIAFVVALAADGARNVFVSYVKKSDDNYSVGVFPASISLGAGFFAPLPELYGAAASIPFGLAVDAAGDLLVGSYTNVGFTSNRQISVFRPHTSKPASQLTYADMEGNENFTLRGAMSPGIFIAPVKGSDVTLQSLTGVTEIQYTLPFRFLTSSIAAYPVEPIGAW